MAIKVLITDDHGVVRQGLRMFLSQDPDLEVVGEAGDGEEALRLARETGPNVVLMDLMMPVMDGIEATRAIKSTMPDVEVVALTSVLEDASVADAVKAGAIGYLLKGTDAAQARRRRNADPPRQFHIGDAAVGLQLFEDLAVDSVETVGQGGNAPVRVP